MGKYIPIWKVFLRGIKCNNDNGLCSIKLKMYGGSGLLISANGTPINERIFMEHIFIKTVRMNCLSKSPKRSIQMKNKRVLVLGIALVLFALVVGVAFAASSLGGVWWISVEGKSPRLSGQSTNFYIEIYNENDYPVTVYLTLGRMRGASIDHKLGAKETIHQAIFDKSARVTRVEGGGKIVRE
jgi:hypothetical protein